MKLSSRWMLVGVALAIPAFIQAQEPPIAPPAPDAGNAPQWTPGPGARMRQRQLNRQRFRRFIGQQVQRYQMQQRRANMARMLQSPEVRERLGITQEQLTRVRTQHSAFAKSMVRQRADMQVKRMELAELMAADTPDRAMIDRKLREISDASYVMQKAQIDNQLAMREVFTPEQRKEMEKMREEFRNRWMQGAPGGPRGPRQPAPAPAPQPPADDSR